MTIQEYEQQLAHMRQSRLASETAKQLEARTNLEQRRQLEPVESATPKGRIFRVDRVEPPASENGHWVVYVHLTDDITIRPTQHMFGSQDEAQAFYDEMRAA